MDIAQHAPSTPDGNPETADAAPPPKAPPLIRREDYRPPDWLVPEIALDFALGLETTRVRSALTVAAQRRRRRQPDASASTATGSPPLDVEVDGQATQLAGAMDGDDLLIDLPGDTHHDRGRRPRSTPRPTAS